jgi:hypothetical protein
MSLPIYDFSDGYLVRVSLMAGMLTDYQYTFRNGLGLKLTADLVGLGALTRGIWREQSIFIR